MPTADWPCRPRFPGASLPMVQGGHKDNGSSCAALAGASYYQCWGRKLLCLALSSSCLHGNPLPPSFSEVGFDTGESNLEHGIAKGARFQLLLP